MNKKLVQGMMVLAAAVPAGRAAWGQESPVADQPVTWETSLVGGYFTGGMLARVKVAGEPVKAEMNTGWLVGVRTGAEEEYLGLELTLAGVFANLDLTADPAAALPSAQDASLFLGDLDVLLFPTGQGWADGRVRPFLCAGPGVAQLNSDFHAVDGETLFDVNVGAGCKFLLGESGNPVLRVDWRWHKLAGGGSNVQDPLYRQEFTAGLGWRF